LLTTEFPLSSTAGASDSVQAFVDYRKASEGAAERADFQKFAIELCRCLGVAEPEAQRAVEALPVDCRPPPHYHRCLENERGGSAGRLAEPAMLHRALATLALLTAPIAATAAPDLVVGQLVAPASASAGDDLAHEVEVVVVNRGDRPAAGTASRGRQGFMIDVFLTRDRMPAGFARFADTYHDGVLLRGGRASRTRDLGAGERAGYAIGGGLPADTPDGTYRLCARVDPGHAVREANETNNTACRVLRIGSAQSVERSVRPDGTLELIHPDGSRELLEPDGTRVIVAPDGTRTMIMKIEVQVADLPALPGELSSWGDRIGERLLTILGNLLTDEEFEAYLGTEDGKGYYERIDWRLRSIAFFTATE
jgi:hypothetical protein